ncbi:MAG: hypothetical protein RLZZ176_2756 [Cyanobacteriota bacterium]|jgi:hypothetical protein
MKPTIGRDALANKAKKLEKYLSNKGIKVILLNRLKSIHGPDDDIIELDIEKTSHLRLLASDHNPGKFELIGIARLIERNQLTGNFWNLLDGLDKNILLPECPEPDDQYNF